MTPRTVNPAASRPLHGPIRVAGVSWPVSPTCSTRTARVRLSAVAMTWPSGAISPETPLVVATATQRPVSIARSRVIANCWSVWSVWMKVAWLLCTTRSSAPLRSWALRPSS